MIHSAKFGSIERFVGVLTEHYAGAFPAWLVAGAGHRHPDLRRSRTSTWKTSPKLLRAQGIRVEVDDVRRPHAEEDPHRAEAKVPFMMIAGGADEEAGAVSFRYRDATQRNAIPIEQAVAEIVDIDRSARERVADRGHVRAAS